MPLRRSNCGNRRETQRLEGCVVRTSPRGKRRQIEVVPNDVGFGTQLSGRRWSSVRSIRSCASARSIRRVRSAAMRYPAVSAALVKGVCTNGSGLGNSARKQSSRQERSSL
eukprot:IDg3955t1